MKIVLNDKVVLITGATIGIGRAIAMALGEAGASVAIASRNEEKLKGVAAKIKSCLVIPTDISDEKQASLMVDKTVGRFGRIDVLINNAAMVVMTRSDSLDPDLLVKAFKTNLVGPVVATNRAVEYMRKQGAGAGHIINIGSPGFMIGLPFLAPYASTKAAMCGWTRSIQSEWEGTGIFVTEYFPGYIKTESLAVSDFGKMGQDVFDDPDQSWVMKILARPKSPDVVAKHIVKCIAKPKRIVYSGFMVGLGVWLSQIPGFRLTIGRKMTNTFCKRMDITRFKD
jgi:2-dehydro-3-deoxy-D-gluconate 5-dehydrogenase